MTLLSLLDIDPLELTGFAREVVGGDPHFLERVLPTRRVEDLDFAIKRGAATRGNVARFRNFDVPAPIGKRPGITEVAGSQAPISQKIQLGEEELLRLQAAISTGRVDPRITAQVYDDVRLEALAIADRFELARGEALHSGAIALAEGGLVSHPITFGRTGSHSVTAGTLWSDHANSVPLTNFRAWNATYYATNKFYPGGWLISTTALNHLLLNEELSAALINLQGVNPSIMTRQQLDQVLAAHGVADLIVYDDEFMVDGVSTRTIPANKIVAIPPSDRIAQFGASFWTTTAEALALQQGHGLTQAESPGIVATIHETEDPVAIWTKAAAIGMPFIVYPDYTFAATVA